MLYSGLARSGTNNFNDLMQQNVLLTHNNLFIMSHWWGKGLLKAIIQRPDTAFSNAKRTEKIAGPHIDVQILTQHKVPCPGLANNLPDHS